MGMMRFASGSIARVHRTGSARSAPPPDRPAAPVPPPPPRWRNWLLLVGVIVSLALFFLPISTTGNVEQLSYSQLKSDISSGQVATVAIGPDGNISGTLTSGTKFASSYPVNLQDPQFSQLLDQHNVQVTTQPAETSVGSIFVSLLPLLLLGALFWWTGRSARRQLAGLGGIGRAKGKLFDLQRPSTTFADVAGYEGAKQEVTEVVDFLKYPDRYLLAGAVGPKGVLMVGPPGTGKTLLARAVAGEAGVPFFSISGSDFVEMFVGVGASRVRDLFEQGKKHAPCIIFIDEIDAVGRHRGAGMGGGHDEREQTLNQLLVEMDGFEANEGIIIIAATNRPDVLDPALLRPGRFDRQVVVPNPDVVGREQILKVHVRKVPLAPDVDPKVIARGTPGFSGADLANLVNEAALLAARRSKRMVTQVEFEDAKDKVCLLYTSPSPRD